MVARLGPDGPSQALKRMMDFCRVPGHIEVMWRSVLLLPLLLAACGEPVGNQSSNAAAPVEPDAVTIEPRAIRIGELGPSFAACSAAGTTRQLEAGGTLPVRSAPFDGAPQTGTVARGGRFFICTNTLDRKWFGIVFDETGALSPRCGVSDAVATRRDYQGPCPSGWVSSPFVKVIAGSDNLPGAGSEPASPAPAAGETAR
jgi:hypothetical protein